MKKDFIKKVLNSVRTTNGAEGPNDWRAKFNNWTKC